MAVSDTTQGLPLCLHAENKSRLLLKKFEANVIRDQQVKTDLERLGWRVITVWECELREPDQLAGRLKEIGIYGLVIGP